jgi:SagB-type dehydrogenase family enzyme
MQEDGERLDVLDTYWRDTLFDLSGVSGDPPRVGPEEYPAPAKSYPGRTRIALADPGNPGDVRAAFADERGLPAGPATLPTLLHYAYGYRDAEFDIAGSGITPVPHRFVASARCMYPSELYVWVPEGRDDAIPPGAHYYDPVHHGLVALRPEADADLGRALGPRPLPIYCSLIITSRFWKVAYRYADYAYRLCTQEAGIVAGHALLVGAALGLSGHMRFQFDDDFIARMLRLDLAEESPMAVIPFMRADEGMAEDVLDRRLRSPATSRVAGVSRRPVTTGSRPGRQGCARFLALDSSSRLAAASRLDDAPDSGPVGSMVPALPAGRRVKAACRAPLQHGCLANVLRRRTSGPTSHFTPPGAEVPAQVFWLLCRYALPRHASDIAEPYSPPVGLMLSVNRVADIDPGVYSVLSDSGICLVAPGDVESSLTAAALNQVILNFRTIPLVVSVVADPRAAGHVLGDRAYRVLNMAAGIVAARVCVLASAAGLAARIYNVYRADAVCRLLRLEGPPGPVPLFQIAVGPVPPQPVLRVRL